MLASPVIAQPCWFDDYDPWYPFALRIELPVSAEVMVAALYFSEPDPAHLSTDAGGVRGKVAVVIVQDGLFKVEQNACIIADETRRGTVRYPEFLAQCRQLVSQVTRTDDGQPSRAEMGLPGD